MSQAKKKNKLIKVSGFLSGYCLGFLAWVAGFHCLELDSQGFPKVSARKLAKHLFKLFLWTVEIVLLVQLLGIYRNWILQAKSSEMMMAVLLKLVVFLYIKAFRPKIFSEILPGLKVFLCPGCFQKQTFKFLPISLNYGFFVTYLCSHCSCLVDGWGEQVFYPLRLSFLKFSPSFIRIIGPIIFTLFIGVFVAMKFFEYF